MYINIGQITAVQNYEPKKKPATSGKLIKIITLYRWWDKLLLSDNRSSDHCGELSEDLRRPSRSELTTTQAPEYRGTTERLGCPAGYAHILLSTVSTLLSILIPSTSTFSQDSQCTYNVNNEAQSCNAF